MKEYRLDDLTDFVDKKRKEINESYVSNGKVGMPSRRTRKRSEDEVQVLNEVTINAWKNAVSSGKIKYLGEREMWYEL